MGSSHTVTIELSDPENSTTVISFLDSHEEFVSPKQPDPSYIVVHSGIHLPSEQDLIHTLLTLDGVTRVGYMLSDDTTNTASGFVYWLDDGKICEYEAFADDRESGNIADRYGAGTVRKIRDELDFEIYSWWDFSVDGMEKRHQQYLKEDIPQKMVDAEVINDVDDI